MPWGNRGHLAVMLVCGALVMLVGAAQASALGTWSIVATPNPSGGSGPQLLADSGDSATDAWTAGVYFSPTTSSFRTLAEHWNGSSWTLTPTPNPLANQQLNGVAAISPANAWAVGFANNSGWATNRTMIVHWNGTLWTNVASPNPTAGEDELWGVWAASATDVWAVGDYTASGGVKKTLAEHWNGTGWSVIPTPNPTSYDDFHRVFGSSSTDVWAVGTVYSGEFAPLVAHWNGVRWSVVPSPSLGDSYIRGGWATSSTDAWIVGEWDGPAPTYTVHQLVYHWNGTSWTSVSSPSSQSYELDGVAARSTTDAWIAGVNSTSSTRQTLLEHWNGTSWSVVSSPNRGTGPNDFYAIAMLPTGVGWAVGDGGGTLIEQTLNG
jgi:hypothetical protein